ncbi:MAG: hypothetical protein QM778_21915 [Myxococcales bacterium]
MSKAILMSVVFALLVIPVRASRESDTRKGLRKMTKDLLIFYVVYFLMLRFLWGRFD